MFAYCYLLGGNRTKHIANMPGNNKRARIKLLTVWMHICLHICVYLHFYIYIYRERERERYNVIYVCIYGCFLACSLTRKQLLDIGHVAKAVILAMAWHAMASCGMP